MTTTTNNTEPCHTCGGEYNCPDCGVWLTREDYDDSRAFHETVGALPPALTRILSEEAAPAEAAPVDAPAPTDPRDAEIAALKAEVAALRDALLNSKPYITVKDMADGFNAVQAVVYKNDYAYTTEYWDGKSSDTGVADAVRLWVQRWAVEFDIPAARIFDTRTNSAPVES